MALVSETEFPAARNTVSCLNGHSFGVDYRLNERTEE